LHLFVLTTQAAAVTAFLPLILTHHRTGLHTC